MSVQSTTNKTPPFSAQTSYTSLFLDSPVKKDPSTFTYSTQHDFGRQIQKLLVPVERSFNQGLIANMKAICAHEGIQLQHSPEEFNHYFVRDAKLPTTGRYVLEPSCSPKIESAIERTHLRSAHRKDRAAELTTDPAYWCARLGKVAESKLHRLTCDGLPTGIQRDSRLYFEGGNCYCITNPKTKKPHYIIGEDLLTITHQSLRQEKWFKKFDKTSDSAGSESILAKYDTLIHKQYVNSQIPGLIQSIAHKISNSLSNAEVYAVLEEMLAMKILNTVEFGTDQARTAGRKIATLYLAQKEFVRTNVFPQELLCDASDITFVPQAAYHIDLMMAPGPKGSIFVQDHDLALQTLLHIKTNAKKFKLDSSDLILLDRFIDRTAHIRDDLTPLLKKVQKELSDAGFTVIPTPGAFLGSTPKRVPINVNFLNCLTGFSPKNTHYYYVTSGAKTDGILGQVLMDVYGEFLESHCNNTKLYFVGSNPDNPQDFSEAMEQLKSTIQAGPHCSTYELEIKPHTERDEEQKHLLKQ